MATANQMRAAARDAMRDGAVVITAADFSADGIIKKVQLYFFDEKEAVMDYVEKDELLDNWPEEGVFVLNPQGDEKHAILPVGSWYDEENDYKPLFDCEILTLLPQILYERNDIYLTFKVHRGSPNNDVKTYSLNLGDIEGIRDWKAGKKYDYTISITSTEILFQVVEVPWIEHDVEL